MIMVVIIVLIMNYGCNVISNKKTDDDLSRMPGLNYYLSKISLPYSYLLFLNVYKLIFPLSYFSFISLFFLENNHNKRDADPLTQWRVGDLFLLCQRVRRS